MLCSAKKLEGNDIVATDGKAGKVKDLVVDSSVWTVQYVMAHRSRWLSMVDLLVPREVIDELENRRLHVSVARRELKPYVWMPVRGRSDEDEIVSSLEADGAGARRPSRSGSTSSLEGPHEDLRSVKSVRGALMEAVGGTAGRVKDVIINPATWHVMALVVATRGRLPGKTVLVPIQWIDGIDLEARVHTHLGREVLRCAPPFDSHTPIDRKRIDEAAAYYSAASRSGGSYRDP